MTDFAPLALGLPLGANKFLWSWFLPCQACDFGISHNVATPFFAPDSALVGMRLRSQPLINFATKIAHTVLLSFKDILFFPQTLILVWRQFSGFPPVLLDQAEQQRRFCHPPKGTIAGKNLELSEKRNNNNNNNNIINTTLLFKSDHHQRRATLQVRSKSYSPIVVVESSTIFFKPSLFES